MKHSSFVSLNGAIVKGFLFGKLPRKQQYAISVLAVGAATILSLVLDNFIHYRNVALIFLVKVSFLAMFLDILQVLLAATLSALVWISSSYHRILPLPFAVKLNYGNCIAVG